MIKINKTAIINYFKKSWIEYVVIAGVLFLDLLSKYLVSHFMDLHETKVIIPKFLNFFYTLNPYAAFSLGNRFGAKEMRIFFIIFVSITTLIFLFIMIMSRKERLLCRLPLALIIGGAIGNLYDRIFFGAVRDFIQVEYFGIKLFGSYTFPTFNIADSALVIGIIVFMLYMIIYFSKDEKIRAEKIKQEKQDTSLDKASLNFVKNAEGSSQTDFQNKKAKEESKEFREDSISK